MKTSIVLLGASALAVIASILSWVTELDQATFEGAVSLALLGIVTLLGWLARPDVRALLKTLNVPVKPLKDSEEVAELKRVAAEQAAKLRAMQEHQMDSLTQSIIALGRAVKTLDDRLDEHIHEHSNGSVSGP